MLQNIGKRQCCWKDNGDVSSEEVLHCQKRQCILEDSSTSMDAAMQQGPKICCWKDDNGVASNTSFYGGAVDEQYCW